MNGSHSPRSFPDTLFDEVDYLSQRNGPCLAVNITPFFASLTSEPATNQESLNATSATVPLGLSTAMVRQDIREDPPAKRRKLNLANEEVAATEHQSNVPKGLDRPISPPLSRRKSPEPPERSTLTWSFDDVPKQTLASRPPPASRAEEQRNPERNSDEETRFIASPIQLTRIGKLAPYQNVDAVGLSDLLGDPLIKECWIFNFLFDIDFVM